MTEMTVMVVDDHEGIRSMLQHYLKKLGFGVVEVACGKDVPRSLEHNHVDLVLLDYSMPDLDGLEVLSSLKRLNPTLPVVMLTGDHSQTLAVQCFRRGAQDFIVKPFDPDYLELVIKRALRDRDDQEQLRKTQICLAAEKASSALKKELLARLGHELKTPLHHLLSHLDFLAEALLPGGESKPIQGAGAGVSPGEAPPSWQKWLSKSLESSQKLAQLVDRLSRIAQLEAGVMPFHPTPVKLRDPLQRALSGCALKAEARKVHLNVVGDESLIVQADGDRLLEAFAELMDNAIQFSPVGGEVTIRVAQDPMGAEVIIADHGPGILDVEKTSVFVPFFLGTRTNDGSGGWGLGLTIAASIIEAHQGSITLLDPPAGITGTLVRIHLPNPANTSNGN